MDTPNQVPRTPIQHTVIGVAAGTVAAVCIVAAALVLLLGGSSDAATGRSSGPVAGTHGGHGAAGGTTAAAVLAAESSTPTPPPHHAAMMVGSAVRAPGAADATKDLLDLPPAQPYQPGRVREFTLDAEEHDLEVADGLSFPAWTFSRPGDTPTVPGPVLRVTEGDTVRITLRNHSTQPHSLHTHGIHPADQDGVLEMVDPGEQRTYEFVAGPSGVQPYHCHAMPVRKHVGKGLYGMLVIDPKVPPPHADREMAMVMNGFDTNYDGENEVYTVNGLAFHYAKYPIHVRRGELVRIFLMNMTENDPINSFHVHGNFFEYRPIGFGNPPTKTDLVTQIQGDRGIVDIRFANTGPFMFHAHQTEFGDLGWMGFFEVTA